MPGLILPEGKEKTVDGLRTHGGNIYRHSCRIDFSASINPLGMPESVRAAAEKAVSFSERYPDPDCIELRKAIAVRDLPLNPDAEYVITGNGAAELIFAISSAVRPKKALLIAPDFCEYEQALRFQGCQIQYYQSRRDQQFRIGEDLLDLISPEIDMICISVPNNPTAAMPASGLMTAAADRAEQCGCILLADECFLGFLDDPEEWSLAGCLPDCQNLVVLRAFTKLYAMPGLRLGYALCGNRKLAADIRAGLQPWNVSVPAQAAGMAAMKEDIFVKRSRAYIAGERQYLQEELAGLGCRIYPSEINYLFFEGPVRLGSELMKDGILIRDCSCFGGLRAGDWRIAVRTEAENRELVRSCRKLMGLF